jgi:vitamin B12 transporter
MARILILLVTGLAVLQGQSQTVTTLSGKVVDPSGAVVAGAEIRLYSRDNAFQRTGRTDHQGAFRLGGLPRGDFLVEARTSGLDQASPQEVHLEENDNQIELKLDIAGLASRVTVTSSSTALSTAEIGKGTDVIDSADWARREEFSVAETLRTLPGLRVQQLGGPGTFARVLTRGLRAIDTAVLIDGMRFRDVASVQGDAAAFIGDLLLIDSDRIEVVRGSGSSLYGTNAMSGVINLVTDQGGGPMHGEVSAEGGGLGMARGLARLSGGALDDRLQYTAGLTYLNVSSGVDGIERVRNWSGQGFAQYRFTPRATLSARVYGTTAMVGINNNPYAAPEANLPPTGYVPAIPLAPDQLALADHGKPFDWGNATFAPNTFDSDSRRVGDYFSGMIAWTQQLTPQASYRVTYQGLSSNRDNTNGPAGSGYQPAFNTYSGFAGRIDTVQARVDWGLARWNLLSAGYEFEREYFDNPSSDASPDPTQRVDARTQSTQKSNAGFFNDQMRFWSDRLQVSLSGRIQGFLLDAPIFTGDAPPYAGAQFAAPPKALTGDASIAYLLPKSSTKLRAHVGNAYRAPALYERFGAYFFLGSFSPIGDPRLSPERSVGFDAGVDQYFASNRMRVSGSFFYSRLQEVIVFGSLTDDPFGRYGGYVNSPGGLARGIELSGEARPWRNTLLQASYTYTNADNRTSDLIGGSLQAIRVFPHMVSVVASQQITPRLRVSADFLGASDYIAGTFFVDSGNRPYLFPGPRKLDASAEYTVPLAETRSLRLYTRIENLLNRQYYEDGFRTPRIWATVGMKFLF